MNMNSSLEEVEEQINDLENKVREGSLGIFNQMSLTLKEK